MFQVWNQQKIAIYTCTKGYASNLPSNLLVTKYQIGTIMCGRNTGISSLHERIVATGSDWSIYLICVEADTVNPFSV